MTKNVAAGPVLPTVFAPGFSPFPLPLGPALARLRKKGYDVSLVPFSLKNMRDVEVFAMRIADAVRAAAARSPTGKVNLIGMSMGGVAGLHAIKRLGIADLVDTFIAVGAPFHGSTASWFAVPTVVFARTGNQLSTRSRYLKKLRAEPLPPGPRYVSVAGSRDLICPQHTALLADTTQVVGLFDHYDIFRSWDVHDLLMSLCR